MYSVTFNHWMQLLSVRRGLKTVYCSNTEPKKHLPKGRIEYILLHHIILTLWKMLIPFSKNPKWRLKQLIYDQNSWQLIFFQSTNRCGSIDYYRFSAIYQIPWCVDICPWQLLDHFFLLKLPKKQNVGSFWQLSCEWCFPLMLVRKDSDGSLPAFNKLKCRFPTL